MCMPMIMPQDNETVRIGVGNRLTIQEVHRATGIEPARIRFYQSTFQDVLGTSLTEDTFDGPQVDMLSRIDRGVCTEGRSLLDMRAELARERARLQVVTVTSGKGGVGKTTVSINLAIAMAQEGRRVLLFDADMGLANVHVFAGITPHATIVNLLDRTMPIRDVLSDGPGGIKVLCGGSGVTRLANLDADDVEYIGRQLTRLADAYDVLVIDTGAGISSAVLHFMGIADDIVFIATPDIAATLDVYGVMKASHQAGHSGRIHLLVNRVGDAEESEIVSNRICQCAQRFLHQSPSVLGYLRRDRALQDAGQKRHPLVVSRPRTANAARFRVMASVIMSQHHCTDMDHSDLSPRMTSLVSGLVSNALARRAG